MSKNFRLANCLVEGKGVKEFAIFSDGTQKAEILTDETYGKYFK